MVKNSTAMFPGFFFIVISTLVPTFFISTNFTSSVGKRPEKFFSNVEAYLITNEYVP